MSETRQGTSVSGPRRWQSIVSTGLVGLALLIAAPFGAAPGHAGAAAARATATSGPWNVAGGPPGPVWALLALPAGGGLPEELIAGGVSRVALSTDGGASWRSTYDGGSLSGQVNVLLALGSDASPNLLAGTTNGLYRSADRGLHWRKVTQGLPAAGVQALAQSGSTLFAGTGSQDTTGVFGGGGLFVSRDAGATWSALKLPSEAGDFVSALAVADGSLFIATVKGSASTLTSHLFIRPTGAAIRLAETGLPAKYRIHALAAGSGWMVAGTGGGFYTSTNGGTRWTRSSQGSSPPFVFGLARDPHQPKTVYGGTLGTGKDDPGAGIWQSADGGQTWHAASKGLPTFMDVHAILPVGGATAPIRLYAATDGVWRSTDGVTWSPSSNGLNFGMVRALAADRAHPGVVFAGVSYSGFYRSADGGQTWQVVNRGLVNNQPEALAYGGSGTLYAGTESFVMRWSGDRWQSVSAQLDKNRVLTALAVGPVPGGTDALYVAGVFGTKSTDSVLRSTDAGRTWKTVTPPVTVSASDPSASAIRYLAVAPTAPVIVYAATGTSLFVSGNGGATWTPTGPAAKNPAAITALVADPVSSQTAYLATVTVNRAATSTAEAFAGATLYRTVDGGLHWTALRAYGPGTIILGIRADGQLMLTGARLTGQHITSLLDQSAATGWRSLANGLPQDVFAYVTASDGHRLYIGSGLHGVWSRDLAESPASEGPPAKGAGPTPSPVIPGA